MKHINFVYNLIGTASAHHNYMQTSVNAGLPNYYRLITDPVENSAPTQPHCQIQYISDEKTIE